MELQPETDDECSASAMELQPETDDESLLLDSECDDAASVSPASCQLELEANSHPSGMDLECDDDDSSHGGFTPAQCTFHWAFNLFTFLDKVIGTRLLRERFQRSITYSSHFSGLGTAEVAMDFIKAFQFCILDNYLGIRSSTIQIMLDHFYFPVIWNRPEIMFLISSKKAASIQSGFANWHSSGNELNVHLCDAGLGKRTSATISCSSNNSPFAPLLPMMC